MEENVAIDVTFTGTELLPGFDAGGDERVKIDGTTITLAVADVDFSILFRIATLARFFPEPPNVAIKWPSSAAEEVPPPPFQEAPVTRDEMTECTVRVHSDEPPNAKRVRFDFSVTEVTSTGQVLRRVIDPTIVTGPDT